MVPVSPPDVRYFDFSGALLSVMVGSARAPMMFALIVQAPYLQTPRAETWVERFTARMRVFTDWA